LEKQLKSLKMKVAAVGITAVAVIGGSMAYALWSASGSGSGSAKALTAQTVTVSASTATADLYPGFTQGDLFFTLTNNNPYGITFSSMTAGTVTSGDPTNCPASNVTVANVASGLGLSVAANASNAANSIPNVVTMVSGAPDGCQGVTFSIALTLSGSQT
jgi:hypothetical protein